MKKMGLFFTLILSFTLFSCGGGSDENESLSDLVEENDSDIRKGDEGDFDPSDCEKESANDWDNFLGIPYGSSELDLDKYLGKNTGGEYTSDSASFVYYFKEADRVPISVWSNAKSTKIEMVFMEVVSYPQYFDEDLKVAVERYGLNECDTKWFGMTEKEVKDIMGEPRKIERDKDSEGKEVVNMYYDSDDYKIAINFKFYESQDFYCSSVMVNWFY